MADAGWRAEERAWQAEPGDSARLRRALALWRRSGSPAPGPLLLRCEGLNVGLLELPPFEVRAGERVCLHLPQPWEVLGRDGERLLAAFTGRSKRAAVQAWGRSLAAAPARAQPPVPTRRDWLARAGGVTPARAEQALRALGLDPEARLEPLEPEVALTLGLAATAAQEPDLLVYAASPREDAAAEQVLAEQRRRGAVLRLVAAGPGCPPDCRCVPAAPAQLA